MTPRATRSFIRGFVYGLALTLVVLSCSSPGVQHKVERAKAHLTNSAISAGFGAAAVAIGGPLGLCIAVAGAAMGTVTDVVMQPEESVRTVTTVVDHRPPLPDGTPQEPVVRTYVNEQPKPAEGNLKLPGSLPGIPPAPGFWDRVWLALQVVWWVVVAIVAAGWALTHPRALSVLWGLVRCAFGLVANAAKTVRLWFARKNTPSPPESKGSTDSP